MRHFSSSAMSGQDLEITINTYSIVVKCQGVIPTLALIYLTDLQLVSNEIDFKIGAETSFNYTWYNMTENQQSLVVSGLVVMML